MGLKENYLGTSQIEDLLNTWAESPSTSEDQRRENAVQVVQNAIESYSPFRYRNIEVFAQGSYRNGTNVKTESDVDICVRNMDASFLDLPEGISKSDIGLIDVNFTYQEFKTDIYKALTEYLGTNSISWGNKAFHLHENTYRIDADVVPTFEHRRYDKESNYLSGTEFHPTNGVRIVNWPHQNYENGVEKNKTTGFRFKKIVRILKNIRNEMDIRGIKEAKLIPSYLIECLIWNVPDEKFGNNSYTEDLRNILSYLFIFTRDDTPCLEWGEVNELKYLFRWQQPWTRQQVNEFIVAVWNYLGFQ